MSRAEDRARARTRAGWRTLTGAVVSMACGLAILGVQAAEADVLPNPIGVHSMLQLNDPPSFMQTMFAEAAAMHVSSIRLDVAPALIYTDPSAQPDFSGLDEITALSQTYHLQVIADLLTIPWWMAACQPVSDHARMARCATDDLADYESVIGHIAARAEPTIRDWEIWNEPDDPSFFAGTPQQYAKMLRAAHDAIKGVDSQANVLLGGISNSSGQSWLAQVFATPGADAVHAFDVANVHERGRLDSLAGDLTSWKKSLVAAGFTGPLWVNEHGYPSDPAFQYDPAYVSGPGSQAAYLTASVATLIDAGAGKVFVTQRDNLTGQYASEGLLGGDVLDPPVDDPQVIQKPAYAAVMRLADCYSALARNCPGPAPVASRTSLVISVAPHGSSATASVSVSDPGSGPVRLGAAALVGVPRNPIAIQSDGCSNQLLEPDRPCRLVLRFRPVQGGEDGLRLVVPSENGRLEVPVTAVAPSVSSLTSPELLNAKFKRNEGRDGVGDRQSLQVELRNPLSAKVHITRVAVSGPNARLFRVKPGDCSSATLAPGGRCRLTVFFTAAKAGMATATLTIKGTGEPLHLALRASAYGPPSIVRITSPGGRSCFGVSSQTQLTVITDQPSSVRWRLNRRTGRLTAACRRRGLTPSATSETRSAASGRTRSHLGAASAGRKSLARAALRLQTPATRLLPGVYQLTVTASNAHGTGPSRTVALNVLS